MNDYWLARYYLFLLNEPLKTIENDGVCQAVSCVNRLPDTAWVDGKLIRNTT